MSFAEKYAFEAHINKKNRLIFARNEDNFSCYIFFFRQEKTKGSFLSFWLSPFRPETFSTTFVVFQKFLLSLSFPFHLFPIQNLPLSLFSRSNKAQSC